MATEGSRSSSSSVDSYIGSLISLTSKSEIRYEGILYNINTEESSIGLTNVRSFGTEGRKKDGLHVAASDKVYEYILFRGSDIKDLQVKSSQPVQPVQPINSDPAIIQSHYPRPPPPAASNSPAVANDPSSTPSTYNPHLGQPGSTFQARLPSYQPGGNVGPWGPSPLPPNTMPMYWPGYYAPPNPLQQSLPPPPQGLGMPQYPSFNQPNTSASSANSLLGPTPSSLPNIPQSAPAYTTTTTSDVNVTIAPIKPNALSGPSFPYTSQPSSGAALGPTLSSTTPSLLTPGQLLQSAPGGGIAPSQSPSVVQNDVEVVQVSRVSSAPVEPPVPVTTEAPPVPASKESQPPILPLPPQTQIAQKTNGATYHNRSNYSYRGRERGRGSGGSRPVMKFTEEFDFDAMNEKFNKDEVWGTLGKPNRSGSKEKDGNATDEDEPEEETDHNLPKLDVKPVYSKDDFFDTLSSSSSDRQSNYGRTRFSEQMKLDTETFGEFSRYRGGGRGGRGPYRGGRSRGGGYYGRGGGGGGYGYIGRGRGGRNPNAANDY